MFGQSFEAHDLALIAFLVVLEGVLSIDNALVLGVLAKRLPKHQQSKALTYGLIGAFVFRLIAIGMATYLLRWRIVKLVGGAYLIYIAVKHFTDFLLAIAMLPFALPVMAACAAAIRIADGAPVLFRQKRIGRGGREFTVVKFRTMTAVGELDQDDRQAAMTGDKDVRITRVGAFLRRARLDELPQLWNILKGEMSFIGPRPEAHVLSGWYTSEIPFYRYRHVVRPGISGWAQVNQGHVAEVDEVHEKLQYDFFYIKYFSPWLDVLIFFKTVRTMLSGFGAR